MWIIHQTDDSAPFTRNHGKQPMKIILLATLLIFTSVSVMAKETSREKPPFQVQQAFHQAHPNARDVEVKKEEQEYGEPLYEFEFKQNGRKLKALYHTDGSFFGYERKLPHSHLPKTVWRNIHRLFPNGKVDEAEVVVDARGKPLAYEVEIEENDNEWKAYFNADGSFINKIRD